ncbi:MAG: hypothetical protein AAFY10_08695, partial [Pseudomonadota bacterium]
STAVTGFVFMIATKMVLFWFANPFIQTKSVFDKFDDTDLVFVISFARWSSDLAFAFEALTRFHHGIPSST